VRTAARNSPPRRRALRQSRGFPFRRKSCQAPISCCARTSNHRALPPNPRASRPRRPSSSQRPRCTPPATLHVGEGRVPGREPRHRAHQPGGVTCPGLRPREAIEIDRVRLQGGRSRRMATSRKIGSARHFRTRAMRAAHEAAASARASSASAAEPGVQLMQRAQIGSSNEAMLLDRDEMPAAAKARGSSFHARQVARKFEARSPKGRSRGMTAAAAPAPSARPGALPCRRRAAPARGRRRRAVVHVAVCGGVGRVVAGNRAWRGLALPWRVVSIDAPARGRQ